jgi:hypothetical protein
VTENKAPTSAEHKKELKESEASMVKTQPRCDEINTQLAQLRQQLGIVEEKRRNGA